MRSLNRVMLIGHLAADPELKQTKKGTTVANFPLATNYTGHDEKGKKREVTDFHRIAVWGHLAEICDEYLAKGTALYLEGRIVNRSYDDKKGERHYRTEIVADNINILTWKKNKSGKEEMQLEEVPENEDMPAMDEDLVSA